MLTHTEARNLRNRFTRQWLAPRTEAQVATTDRKSARLTLGRVSAKALNEHTIRQTVQRRSKHVRFFFDDREPKVKAPAVHSSRPDLENPTGIFFSFRGKLPASLASAKVKGGFINLNDITPSMVEAMGEPERKEFISKLAGGKVLDGSLNPPTGLTVLLSRLSADDGAGSTLNLVASIMPEGQEVSASVASRLVEGFSGFLTQLKISGGGGFGLGAQRLLADVSFQYLNSRSNRGRATKEYLSKGKAAGLGPEVWGVLVNSAMAGLARVGF